MELTLFTKSDFRASNLCIEAFNKCYCYDIEIIKQSLSISRHEPNKKESLDFDDRLQYIIPNITGLYCKLILPKDYYYSIYFWKNNSEAFLIHSNTSWSDVPYYKEYSLYLEIKNQPKVPRNKPIMSELIASKKVVIESKEFLQEFDSFYEFLYKVLDTLYTRQDELIHIIKEES